MTQPPKDYTSTLMRMAGNIAAGMCNDANHNFSLFEIEQGAAVREKIARAALALAREILKQATEDPDVR